MTNITTEDRAQRARRAHHRWLLRGAHDGIVSSLAVGPAQPDALVERCVRDAIDHVLETQPDLTSDLGRRADAAARNAARAIVIKAPFDKHFRDVALKALGPLPDSIDLPEIASTEGQPYAAFVVLALTADTFADDGYMDPRLADAS